MSGTFDVALTTHARQRCAKRGISLAAVRWAYEHGRLIHAGGARFVFVGRREIKAAWDRVAASHGRSPDRGLIDRCHGLVVLLAEDGSVITAYKNARALADIRRKASYLQPCRRLQRGAREAGKCTN